MKYLSETTQRFRRYVHGRSQLNPRVARARDFPDRQSWLTYILSRTLFLCSPFVLVKRGECQVLQPCLARNVKAHCGYERWHMRRADNGGLGSWTESLFMWVLLLLATMVSMYAWRWTAFRRDPWCVHAYTHSDLRTCSWSLYGVAASSLSSQIIVARRYKQIHDSQADTNGTSWLCDPARVAQFSINTIPASTAEEKQISERQKRLPCSIVESNSQGPLRVFWKRMSS